MARSILGCTVTKSRGECFGSARKPSSTIVLCLRFGGQARGGRIRVCFHVLEGRLFKGVAIRCDRIGNNRVAYDLLAEASCA